MSPTRENGYRGVSLMKELVDAVEKLVQNHPNTGYKNIAEFIADAVRRRLEEVRKAHAISVAEKGK